MNKAAIRIILILMGLIPLVFYSNCSQVPGSSNDSQGSSLSTNCLAPAGVSNTPETIEEAVRLINALPKPVTLPCFIQSLGKPLNIVASQSSSSAQPSVGLRSPRIFIFGEQLIMTVVPAGIGKDLLEFGQLVSSSESIKGELEFPIATKISATLPFTRIASGGGTTCTACHRPEYPTPGSSYSFTSKAIMPSSFGQVSLSDLQLQSELCNTESEPYRCAILRSLF